MPSGFQVTPITEEQGERIERWNSRLLSLAKCSLTAGTIVAATSAAVHYFGGPEYTEHANTIFESSLYSLLGTLPYITHSRASGVVLRPERPTSSDLSTK